MVYSYIDSKKTVKESIHALNDEMGNRVEDPREIVKILNNQFKSVFCWIMEKYQMFSMILCPKIAYFEHEISRGPNIHYNFYVGMCGPNLNKIKTNQLKYTYLLV